MIRFQILVILYLFSGFNFEFAKDIALNYNYYESISLLDSKTDSVKTYSITDSLNAIKSDDSTQTDDQTDSTEVIEDIDSTQSNMDIDSIQIIDQSDTNQTIVDNDTTQTEDEIESDVTDEETVWTYSAYLSVKNKSLNKGISISKGKALMEIGSDLSYYDLSFSVSIAKQAFDNIWSDYALGLNYTYSLTDWFEASIEAEHFKYFNDTLNPNSDNSMSLIASLSLYFSDFTFDLGFQRLFGVMPVNYFSATLSYSLEIGDFQLTAIGDITTNYYSKVVKEKMNRVKKLTNMKSLIYTGILSLSYNLPMDFDLGISGTITEDYKGKITPIVKFRLGYSFDF